MGIYKSYVKNQDRIEGCIFERYVIEKTISFYAYYMRGLEVIYDHLSCNNVGSDGRPMSNGEVFNLDKISLEQAHQCILMNLDEVQPWVE